jgi:hypothetical protein
MQLAVLQPCDLLLYLFGYNLQLLVQLSERFCISCMCNSADACRTYIDCCLPHSLEALLVPPLT